RRSGRPLPPGYCKSPRGAVLQTDFSADSAYLKVTSASYTAQVFTAPLVSPLPTPISWRNITWQTWTSIVGPPVRHQLRPPVPLWGGYGYWDDFGNVKLFAFPVTEPEAQHKDLFLVIPLT
uniref:Gal_mutarotas_2 domain-containing protein n=1 Tax=Macrostomum lignano TaxID=282301 RepID=A0A1I8FE93_9PLAT